ncbi:MAG: cytochrome c biogenesis protein ResB [Clostridiales bacterium]|nr:cytochrome c biogenesis protein ResB [Clostridiales bacterium]
MKMEEKDISEPKGKKYGCLIILILIVIPLIIILFTVKKDATNDDVTINQGETGLLSYSFTFIPKNDIDDLQFEISFYDSNGKYISDITKTVGDVKKGQQYTVTVNLTELSFSQAFSNKISVKVSGGKVALIS